LPHPRCRVREKRITQEDAALKLMTDLYPKNLVG